MYIVPLIINGLVRWCNITPTFVPGQIPRSSKYSSMQQKKIWFRDFFLNNVAKTTGSIIANRSGSKVTKIINNKSCYDNLVFIK